MWFRDYEKQELYPGYYLADALANSILMFSLNLPSLPRLHHTILYTVISWNLLPARPVDMIVHLEETKSLAAARWARYLLLNNVVPLLLAAVGAAGEEHNDHAEEEAHKRREQSPDTSAKACMAAGPILVDVVTNDAEQAEVGCEGDECQDPGEESHHCAHKATHDTGAQREQERNESDAGFDWMKYHNASEGV